MSIVGGRTTSETRMKRAKNKECDAIGKGPVELSVEVIHEVERVRTHQSEQSEHELDQA
jgi:hypothetical protein